MKKRDTKSTSKSITNKRSRWGGGNFSCRHPKLWEYIKSNVKAFFITGAIVFTISASANTVRILHSRQVRYKNDKSVEQAINELYEKAEQCGKVIGCPGCTKLEYLESTGTQYIDTGIIPNENFKAVIDFETKSDVSTEQNVLGLIQNSRLYALAWDSGKLYFGYNSWFWGDSNISTNTRYTVESNFKDGLQRILINDQLIKEQNNTISNPWTSSLYLFASHSSSVEFKASIKLYSCKIYNNNILVRDYIPLFDIDNDRPCLFDKVSKTCFYNQGTGEFLYG